MSDCIGYLLVNCDLCQKAITSLKERADLGDLDGALQKANQVIAALTEAVTSIEAAGRHDATFRLYSGCPTDDIEP